MWIHLTLPAACTRKPAIVQPPFLPRLQHAETRTLAHSRVFAVLASDPSRVRLASTADAGPRHAIRLTVDSSLYGPASGLAVVWSYLLRIGSLGRSAFARGAADAGHAIGQPLAVHV